MTHRKAFRDWNERARTRAAPRAPALVSGRGEKPTGTSDGSDVPLFRGRFDDGGDGHARDAALRQQHVRAVLDGPRLVPERSRLGAPPSDASCSPRRWRPPACPPSRCCPRASRPSGRASRRSWSSPASWARPGARSRQPSRCSRRHPRVGVCWWPSTAVRWFAKSLENARSLVLFSDAVADSDENSLKFSTENSQAPRLAVTGLGASRRPRARGWGVRGALTCEGPRGRVGEREGEGGGSDAASLSRARVDARGPSRRAFSERRRVRKGVRGLRYRAGNALATLRFIARGVCARKGARGGPRDRARARETPATRSGHYSGALARTSTVERTNATAARSDDGASESRFFSRPVASRKSERGQTLQRRARRGARGQVPPGCDWQSAKEHTR